MEYTGFEVGGFDEDAYQCKVAFSETTDDETTSDSVPFVNGVR